MKQKTISNTRGAAAIRQSMIELLSEIPYEDITVGDIITRSTYSKSCFYRNYYDKLDVAEQIVKEEAGLYVGMLIAQMKLSANITDEVQYNYVVSLGTFRYIEMKQKLYHLLFRNKFPGMGVDYFCNLAVENFDRTVPFQIDPNYSRDKLDFFEYCYAHMVLRYIHFWESKDFRDTPEQMAERVVSLCRMAKPQGVYL